MAALPASFSLSSVSPAAFTYVAEGGANLVAAYTGNNNDNDDYNNNDNDKKITTADDNFLRGSVLRIRKKAHGAPVLSETTLKEEDASVAFTDAIVVPLLPPHSTPRLISIPIHDKTWLEALAEHLQASRPASRRSIDDIDIDRGYVVLADNLVGTANDDSMQLAVEIKVCRICSLLVSLVEVTNMQLLLLHLLSSLIAKMGILTKPRTSLRPFKTYQDTTLSFLSSQITQVQSNS